MVLKSMMAAIQARESILVYIHMDIYIHMFDFLISPYSINLFFCSSIPLHGSSESCLGLRSERACLVDHHELEGLRT